MPAEPFTSRSCTIESCHWLVQGYFEQTAVVEDGNIDLWNDSSKSWDTAAMEKLFVAAKANKLTPLVTQKLICAALVTGSSHSSTTAESLAAMLAGPLWVIASVHKANIQYNDSTYFHVYTNIIFATFACKSEIFLTEHFPMLSYNPYNTPY